MKPPKFPPILDVINIACFGVGMVPSTICFAVSTAVGTANQIAQKLQIRYRTNTFLDQINERMFRPRGLFCMAVTYKPGTTEDLVLEADMDSPNDVALFKAITSNSKSKKLMRKLRLSNCKSTEKQLPEFAPLIYPNLDLVLASQDLTKQSSFMAKNNRVVQYYLDRRSKQTSLPRTPTPNSPRPSHLNRSGTSTASPTPTTR